MLCKNRITLLLFGGESQAPFWGVELVPFQLFEAIAREPQGEPLPRVPLGWLSWNGTSRRQHLATEARRCRSENKTWAPDRRGAEDAEKQRGREG
jgi:hypothetical protein